MRKQVMSLAWALYKSVKTNFTSFGEALRKAWVAVKAKAAIKNGGAIVQFVKSDGTVATRPAQPFSAPVKGTGKSNPLTILYFNPLKKTTGSFRADRLVDFVGVADYLVK